MDIVGIDLSLTSTGLAYIDGSLATIKSTPSGYALSRRHARLESITGHILAAAGLADVAYIEGPSLGQKAQAGVVDRMGLWWMVVAALRNAGTEVIEVPPTTLKKFATGKGNATKADMRMELFKRAEVDVKDDNQVDAAWLRMVGLARAEQLPFSLPSVNMSALDKLNAAAVE